MLNTCDLSKMEWSNETVMEFLELYEQESVIWNASHPLHKNRNEVFDAWNRIEEKLTIKCAVSELKKKKESLMARFRQCYTKVKESSKSGAGADDVYKPIWFAYEKMVSFLKNKDQPRETINSMAVESQVAITNDMECENGEDGDVESGQEQDNNLRVPNDAETAIENSEALPPSAGKKDTFKPLQQKKRRTYTSDLANVDDDAYNILKEATQKKVTSNDRDEYDIYGALLASKLRKLDDGMRDYVMNQIDNFLFKAKTSPTLNYERLQLQHQSQQPFQRYATQNTEFPSATPLSAAQWISPLNYQDLYSAGTPSRTHSLPASSDSIAIPAPSPSTSSSDVRSTKNVYENFPIH